MKRLTVRVKLTVLYGGLFLIAGVILLGTMFLLVRQSLTDRLGGGKAAFQIIQKGTPGPTGRPAETQVADAGFVRLSDGRVLTPQQALDFAREQQNAAVDSTLSSLLTDGGIALGAVGAIAVGFGWLMAERTLRPVHAITATARRVAAGADRGLHERIALTGPRDEIKELADTFDDMLERLDRSFDGQRRFAANASHELRTPLAINRAIAEVAVTRPTASADARQLGETMLAVNARHERLIDGLLTLADSENEVTDRVPVDLSAVAGHVLAGADTRDLVRREAPLEPAPVLGDPVLLERVVQNLVENAIRYNTPGGWLSVQTGQSPAGTTLTVTNSGPVVAPYQIETIFEPFRRLSGERQASPAAVSGQASPAAVSGQASPAAVSGQVWRAKAGADRGVGLGLSIVRAVARAHGGEATAMPHPGGGLVVTVHLPAPG